MAASHPKLTESDSRRLDRLDLELILYFTAVAEEASFTRAARRLDIDQSWLSRKIRQLEEQLGCQLIQRTTRRVDLTPHGEALLVTGRRLADAAAAAREEVERLFTAAIERLRIGALPYSFTDPARIELIHAYANAHPNVILEVSNNASWVNANWVRSGRLDIAFASSPFDVRGLDVLITMPNVYKVMVPLEDPLSRQSEIHISELAGRRLVTPPQHRNPYTYAEIYTPLVEAGAIPVPAPEFERYAMRRFALKQRLLKLLNVTVDEDVLEGYAAVALVGHPQRSHKCLVRRKGDPDGVTESFWRFAAEHGGHPLLGVEDDGTWRVGEAS